MFTAKAKRKFKKWYENTHLPNCGKEVMKGTNLHYFTLMSTAMQWGIIQEFADSEELDLFIDSNKTGLVGCLFLLDLTTIFESEVIETREETRKLLISELNKHLNKKQ